jgi:predicted choloylglycine hydrolase
LLDREADYATIVIAPGEASQVTRAPIATNHQRGSNWPKYEEKVQTALRFEYLNKWSLYTSIVLLDCRFKAAIRAKPV